MAAALFARSGYFVAPDESRHLRPADQFNEGGYWEAEPLIERNAELFHRAGYPCHNSWLFTAPPPDLAQRIARLDATDADCRLLENFEANRPWVWKDPRLCLTLGFWTRLAEPSSTAILWIRRRPEAIFNSFVRLGWRNSDDSARSATLALIDLHMRAVEAAVCQSGFPCLELDYEQFAEAPQQVADQVNTTFGTSLSAAALNFRSGLDHSTGLAKLNDRLRQFASRQYQTIKRTLNRPGKASRG